MGTYDDVATGRLLLLPRKGFESQSVGSLSGLAFSLFDVTFIDLSTRATAVLCTVQVRESLIGFYFLTCQAFRIELFLCLMQVFFSPPQILFVRMSVIPTSKGCGTGFFH